VTQVHAEQRDRGLEYPLRAPQDGAVAAEDDHELDAVLGPDRLVQRHHRPGKPRLDLRVILGRQR
jgi:hypothetical protein